MIEMDLIRTVAASVVHEPFFDNGEEGNCAALFIEHWPLYRLQD